MSDKTKPFERRVSYVFSIGSSSWEVTDWSDSHVDFQDMHKNGQEDTRKNGQEDTHMYGNAEKVDGTWRWTEPDDEYHGGSSICTYWSEEMADALLTYLNEHGAPPAEVL